MDDNNCNWVEKCCRAHTMAAVYTFDLNNKEVLNKRNFV
jgi:hypothetical protein